MWRTLLGLSQTLFGILVMVLHCDVLTSALSCDTGWVEFQDSCYGVFINLPKPGSLNNAINFCRSYGAYVVTIENAEENSFVQNEVAKYNNRGRSFLGIHDYWSEGTFQTMSGEIITYDNFQSPEPDNGGPTGIQENCIFHFAKTGIWKDQNCHNNTKVDIITCEKGLKQRSTPRMTKIDDVRLDNPDCLLESHTVSSTVECAVNYVNSGKALSFNVARNISAVSPNCYIMECTPKDVSALSPAPNWILYHYPEIY